MNDWTPAAYSLPPEGVTVDTVISDIRGTRNQAHLKRYGNLWMFEDGSMYVYYTPTHWRNLNE